MQTDSSEATADSKLALIKREYPPYKDSTYLNSGSCGRKPESVLAALEEGWRRLNHNPTYTTFLDPEPRTIARNAAAAMLGVDAKCLLLTHNTTTGLQLLMASFLAHPGDELVTTNQEHGSVNSIARYLEETKGIVVRKHTIDPYVGSEEFVLGLLSKVTEKTKLVVVSEIGCFTGWRPDLSYLIQGLEMLDVPLLVDGAHSPGNGRCNPSRYPMWVGSGHKWLGGPNGTGFAYVAPHLVPWLEPVNIGDKYFEMKEADVDDITRFESLGTTDVVRWYGLARACQLQMELGLDFVKSKQVKLMRYVREKIDEVLGAQFRTPDLSDEESTGMVTFLFPQERLIVEDLRESLWKEYRIWVQPDFINVANPGHGMRISCHINNTEDDINALVEAISSFVL